MTKGFRFMIHKVKQKHRNKSREGPESTSDDSRGFNTQDRVASVGASPSFPPCLPCAVFGCGVGKLEEFLGATT